MRDHKTAIDIVSKLKEKRAETLLEVVLSIALFGMTALMVASMFAMANKVSVKNIKTDQQMDQMITDIITEQNLDANATVSQKLIFKKSDGSLVEHEVERVKSGSLYKFRETP